MRLELVAFGVCLLGVIFTGNCSASKDIALNSAQIGRISLASGGPVLLHATVVAPDHAKGSAEFVHSSSPGTKYGLSLRVEGLSPGHYVVKMRRKAGGQPMVLAPIAVLDPTASPDPHSYEDSRQPRHTYGSSDLRVHAQVPLPPGLKPADIARVSVANAAGNDVLTGVVAR